MTLGAYIHVPFCLSRCGYCDFNTYTADELLRDGISVNRENYADHVLQEIALTNPDEKLASVFFGGGTPNTIGAAGLVRILAALQERYGLVPNAEVTTEANPDSITEADLAVLIAGGFNRISFGHQSSAEHVLATLERTHTPGATWRAVAAAKDAGFTQVSVDLIYNTPGESFADLQRTLEQTVASGVNHVSAYSLIVEPGTRLAARISRGELPHPADDAAAERYELIDQELQSAGFTWYEVSNWAKPGGQCRHNLGYWRGDDWLGIGPGAHAFRAGKRSWNHKHPGRWAADLAAGKLPIADSETLSTQDIARETVMLRLRLREGLPASALSAKAQREADLLANEGLIHPGDPLVLTDRGRLLADGIVARLWD